MQCCGQHCIFVFILNKYPEDASFRFPERTYFHTDIPIYPEKGSIFQRVILNKSSSNIYRKYNKQSYYKFKDFP